MLQSALVLGNRYRVPDGDAGCENGLDVEVEVHHDCLRQAEFHQLPREVNPLLFLNCERADVLLPLEALADHRAQKTA